MLGEYLGAGSGTTKILYHFNGNSNDSSGNANNGSDSNITYSLTDKFLGQGAVFTYAGQSIITSTGNVGVSGNAARSVALRAKSTDSTRYYTGSWGVESAGRLFSIVIPYPGNYYLGLNNIDWDTGIAHDGNINDVVFTHDGSTVKLYVNGLYKASASKTLNTDNNQLRLGRFGPTNAGYFTGSLDEYIIENVTWSDSYIRKKYTYAKGRFGII